ncbi:Voltage-dependent L-type calcium channel subunit alpha-1D [Monoraphidium neglectum]|uniref:Voltage-dependent L-type calcium channel subunit alpha-1D n=1 Tax=Monoraphidium neglectum TaxID=145388 RepID=A0A0D2MIH4_9CHLO|nr:Voltage-dependent L-type calcium channel subunit alpha-1D [Monoraphidium neglectum]KIZ02840.1 Voltage-dependent L-type calcium channel subunit alpha-1D [Monoraphidium neglectum]|eukprot:XP_013901859.1 Voltage-dependent L-type calcium channel subunit alpha-1D [Monoraphidium neglectum]
MPAKPPGAAPPAQPWRGRRGGYVGRALGVLPLSSPARRALITFAESRAFRGLSICAIVAYAAILGTSQPAQPPTAPANLVVEDSNIGFTVWFTLELAIKILAFGLVLRDGETPMGVLAAAGRGARRLWRKLAGPADVEGGPDGAGAGDHGRPGDAGRPHHGAVRGEEGSSGGAARDADAAAAALATALTSKDIESGPVSNTTPRSNAPPASKDAAATPPAGADTDAARDADGDSSNGSGALIAEVSLEGGGPASAGGADDDTQPPFLRVGWNVFDFIVVLLSLISLLPGVGSGASALRAFRLLLPLRVVSALPSLKTSINALIAAAPALSTIGAGIAFIVVLWGVLGMQLFQDPMHNNCVAGSGNDTASASGNTCSLFTGPWPGPGCPAEETCAAGGAAPEGGQLSFDNFGTSVIPMFITMTAADWSKVLRPTMNATAGWAYVYFVTLLVVGYVLVLSLVLATLAGAFVDEQQRERREAAAAGEAPPSAFSRALAAAKARAASFYWQQLPGPLERLAKARGWALFEAITEHWAFEAAVIMAVIANTVLLSMQYASMSDSYAAALDLANNVLSFVFLAEALVKIAAQGRAYFTSPFNCFDVSGCMQSRGRSALCVP